MNTYRGFDGSLRLSDIAAWNVARALDGVRRTHEHILETRVAAFLRDEGVDDRLVRRALDDRRAEDRSNWVRLGGVAAAAAILAISVFGGWRSTPRPNHRAAAWPTPNKIERRLPTPSVSAPVARCAVDDRPERIEI